MEVAGPIGLWVWTHVAVYNCAQECVNMEAEQAERETNAIVLEPVYIVD